MEQAGGHVVVYSELGRGTTFKLYFPKIEEEESNSRARPTVAVAKGTETVLLAEDDHDLCEITTELLQNDGYRVLAAEDGPAALARVAEFHEPIHLLLTDMVLPGLNGIELANLIQKTHPNLKVLFMSGYTGTLVAHQGVLNASAAFIEKPFTRQALLRQLREVLE
jgi:CheY-like chemotaxis protein